MSEELVEKVARAMCDIGPGEGLCWEFYVEEARAAIAVVAADADAFLERINHTNTADLLRKHLEGDAK